MQLYNKLSAKERAELIDRAGKDRLTLSFYQYANIDNPQQLRDQLFVVWDKLDVLGRIYVAYEGVNAQLSLPAERFEAFKTHLDSIAFLKDIRLNIAVEQDNKSFLKLKIKVRNKIVADGLNDDTFDVTNKGVHLNAKEFNTYIEDENTVLVDMRNHYESEIGHFKNAVTPDVDTFRDSLDIIEEDGVEDCLMSVASQKADATIGNLAVVSFYLNYKGFQNLKIACPTAISPIKISIGINKTEPILQSILQKGLNAISTKEMNAIVQDWVSVRYEHGVDMAEVWRKVYIGIGVVLIIIFLIFMWNRYLKKQIRLRKKAEAELQESLDMIREQKLLIEEKNNEVMDSIQYAKRIQNALLPSDDLLKEHFKDSFVLYLPKDIVAGDFYWMDVIDEYSFVAAADCTGHGVPGALVSLVGANAGIGISLGDDCIVEAGLYVTAGTKVKTPDGQIVSARELSGHSGLLYRRNSQTGAVEALATDSSRWGGLNSSLHAND